jgi:hypothetical protein
MITLLVIAVTWLAVLAVVVGMLSVGTRTPTPRPGLTPFSFAGHEHGAPSGPAQSKPSPPGLAPTPLEAA